MPEPHLLRIARWAHELSVDDIPPRVLEKARLQMLSVIGAIHASARHQLGLLILESVRAWSAPGPSTLIATGERVDTLSAIYANASLSLALDYDDYLLFGHTGHSAVCVSLAMAERQDRSLGDAMLAQVIANEIEGRLGAAVLVGPHNGQAWSHIHLAGAAAASAKLLGLSVEQTAHAMAIALYQPTYLLWPGFMGPDSKVTTAATPCVAGVQAALLAANGASGALDLLEHPQGYLRSMSYLPLPAFLGGLGRAWVTDTLAYKIYPGCAYIDTAVDAALALHQRFREAHGRDPRPDDVKEVIVCATALTIGMDGLSRAAGIVDRMNPVVINFSIPTNVAIALSRGRLTVDDLRADALSEGRADLQRMASKVRLRHDPALTTSLLEALDAVLDIAGLTREVGWVSWVGAVAKVRKQHGSSAHLDRSHVQAIWHSGVIRSIARRAVRSASGYDFGDRDLSLFTMPFAARVSMTLRDGSTMTAQQDIPRGGPGLDAESTRALVEKKLVREVRRDGGQDVLRASRELGESVRVLLAP